MPVDYLRSLTSTTRSPRADRHLGVTLAFVAGATNAGGLLAVGAYTSHMTGMVSTMADSLVLGQVRVAATALVSVVGFTLGAVSCALLVQWGRTRGLRSEFALPLLFEAVLLLGFGLYGAPLHTRPVGVVDVTIVLLCFLMGLQNAIVTKVSRAVIRTTHVTGLLTDIGIEAGREVYWWLSRTPPDVDVRVDNRDRLSIHAALVAMFFVGGTVGAASFASVGFLAAVPLALALFVLAVVPVADDARGRFGGRA